ncbi:MAG: YdcF family protein [Oligoflexia bacterium]|nr:YdcF family protein [Oligoflexia bacterium]
MFYSISKLLNILIIPTTYMYLLPLVILLLMLLKKRQVKHVVLLYLFYFFLITSPLVSYLYQSYSLTYPAINNPPPLAAAVILSGDALTYVRADDRFFLNKSFQRQLDGLRLLQKQTVQKLILSRGNNQWLNTGFLNEGDAFLKLLQDLNISYKNNSIIIIDDVLNTYEEALKVKALLQQEKIDHFYLVTTAIHMKRAMKVFQKQGMSPVAFPVYAEPIALDRDSRSGNFHWHWHNPDLLYQLLHEEIGIFAYTLKGYI